MKAAREHSFIHIVWPLQLKSHCYCFCLHREFYNKAIDGTHKNQKKIVSLTKEIRLFYLRGLLISLKSCSDRKEKG